MLTILAFGALSAIVAWRNPDRTWSRLLGVVVSLPTIAAGAWLALSDISFGARLFGGVVTALGVAAFGRSARKG